MRITGRLRGVRAASRGQDRLPVFATCPVVILAHSQTIADQGEKNDGHCEFHSSRRTSGSGAPSFDRAQQKHAFRTPSLQYGQHQLFTGPAWHLSSLRLQRSDDRSSLRPRTAASDAMATTASVTRATPARWLSTPVCSKVQMRNVIVVMPGG